MPLPLPLKRSDPLCSPNLTHSQANSLTLTYQTSLDFKQHLSLIYCTEIPHFRVFFFLLNFLGLEDSTSRKCSAIFFKLSPVFVGNILLIIHLFCKNILLFLSQMLRCVEEMTQNSEGLPTFQFCFSWPFQTRKQPLSLTRTWRQRNQTT